MQVPCGVSEKVNTASRPSPTIDDEEVREVDTCRGPVHVEVGVVLIETRDVIVTW